MPLADLPIDPVAAPDVTGHPRELLWRPTRAANPWRMLVFVFTGFALAIAALLGCLVLVLTITPLPPLAIGVGILLVLVAVGVVALVWLILYAAWMRKPPRRAAPSGIVATREGLIQRRGRKPDITILWEDVRLFEVASSPLKRADATVFAVYGSGRTVMWYAARDDAADREPVDGASAEEMVRRQDVLVNLIAARTGLRPRTLSRRLAAAPLDLGEIDDSAWGGHPWRLAMVIVVVAAAWMAWALPLTRWPLVNIYASVALALAGAANLAYAPLISALRRSNRKGVTSDAAGHLRLQRRAPDACRLEYSVSRARSLRLMISGAALTLNAAPFVLGIVAVPVFQPPWVPQGARYFIESVLAFSVLAGIGLVLAGWLSSGGYALVADADGISEGHGTSVTTIPWSEVVGIGATWNGSAFEWFTVTHGETGQSISWRPDWVRAPRNYDPASLTGEELAALVSERSGKQIRIEWA